MLRLDLLRELVAGAPFEPATCVFRAYEVGHLLQCESLRTAGRVLDLGCGNGWIGGLLKRHVGERWDLVGIDRDPSEAALARASGNYSVVHTCDAATVPEPNGGFDLIFSNSVLEHAPNIDGILRECRRLLRPGGRLVITIPSETFHATLSGPGILGWLATGERTRDRYLRALDERLAHVRYWSPVEWFEGLERAGLKPKGTSTYLDRVELRRWEILANLTGGLVSRVFAKGSPPIEVQRRLGMRRVAAGAWARRLSWVVCRASVIGVPPPSAPRSSGEPPRACLLVEAGAP